MTPSALFVHAVFDDGLISLDELCRIGAVSPQWVAERVAEGLLGAQGDAPSNWRFDAPALRRVRCMVRIERHFDAVPELAALVADLLEDMDAMRARLARLGG